MAYSSLDEQHVSVSHEDNDVASLVSIYGNDANKRKIIYQVISTPRKGIIYDIGNPTIPMKESDVLSQRSSFPYNEAAKLLYKSIPGWFSIPDSMANGTLLGIRQDSFTFKTIALDADGQPGQDASLPVEHIVKVINVNDPPVFDVSETQLTVYATSSLLSEDDFCWDLSKPETCFCAVRLRNVSLLDMDLNVDRIRIDISANIGFLSLNADDLHLADFNTCMNRTGYWNCEGSGTNDQKVSKRIHQFEFLISHFRLITLNQMTFLSQPDDVERLLSRMTYRSFATGTDEIQITIYDGLGDECPNEEEHRVRYDESGKASSSSIHPSCYIVSKTIPVVILQTSSETLTISSSLKSVPMQAWVGIGGLLIYFLFAAIIMYKNYKSIPQGEESNNKNHSMQNYVQFFKSFKRWNKETCKKLSSMKRKRATAYHMEGTESPNDSDDVQSDGSINKDEDESNWLGYNDGQSNRMYFMNVSTRRVTWTEPPMGYTIVNTSVESQEGGHTEGQNNNNDLKEPCTPDKVKNDCNGFNKSSDAKWIPFTDEKTGKRYFMNVNTRRVTWTQPPEKE